MNLYEIDFSKEIRRLKTFGVDCSDIWIAATYKGENFDWRVGNWDDVALSIRHSKGDSGKLVVYGRLENQHEMIGLYVDGGEYEISGGRFYLDTDNASGLSSVDTKVTIVGNTIINFNARTYDCEISLKVGEGMRYGALIRNVRTQRVSWLEDEKKSVVVVPSSRIFFVNGERVGWTDATSVYSSVGEVSSGPRTLFRVSGLYGILEGQNVLQKNVTNEIKDFYGLSRKFIGIEFVETGEIRGVRKS